MANKPSAATMKLAESLVQEEDMEELQAVLHDLQARSDKAAEDGRIFMMKTYITLIAYVQPEITRIRARWARESLAAMRKHHKMLKAAQGGEDEQESA